MEALERGGQLRHAWDFVQAVQRIAGARLYLVLGLILLVGLLQGAGVLLLVPLLGVVGLEGVGAGGDGPVGAIVSFFFERLGLPRELSVLLVLYALLVGLTAWLTRRQTLWSFGLQLDVVRTLRNRFYETLSHANWLFFVRTRSSDAMQILTMDLGRVGQGVGYLLQIAAGTVVIMVHLAIALHLSLVATAVTCFSAGMLLLLLRSHFRNARAAGQEQTAVQKSLVSTITEHLGSMKLTKSYNAEAHNIRHFAAAVRDLDEVILRFVRVHTGSQMWLKIGSVVLLCALLYGAVELMTLPLASLLILIYLFSRMMPKFASLQQGVQQLFNMLPAYEAALDFERKAREAREQPAGAQAPDGPLAAGVQHGIRLEDVGFRYPGEARRFLLTGIETTIEANRTTAIVGPSGSGKSTLADLLMGLLVPEEGRVLVDGVPLEPSRFAAWRARIGYVPQETFLFHDTVRANLLWARAEATEEDLWEALRLASAADFIRGLPDGLDTVVGDRGMRLSGGERQRIALARALLRRPALLVLDEATSALDGENERRIQEAIQELHGRLTIVVITHRLSSIRWVDRILVMADGRLTEAGSWDELVALNTGHFRRLAQDFLLDAGNGG